MNFEIIFAIGIALNYLAFWWQVRKEPQGMMGLGGAFLVCLIPFIVAAASVWAWIDERRGGSL